MTNVHSTEGGWPIHMNHQTLVPEPFDPLSSLKIVSTGILIAQPYAAALCAEMGAEVIQVERALALAILHGATARSRSTPKMASRLQPTGCVRLRSAAATRMSPWLLPWRSPQSTRPSRYVVHALEKLPQGYQKVCAETPAPNVASAPDGWLVDLEFWICSSGG
jgi:hypothetical protein